MVLQSKDNGMTLLYSLCVQGSKEGDYVGFTSREGKGSKKYFCHLLLAQNKKQVSVPTLIAQVFQYSAFDCSLTFQLACT